MSVSSFEFEYLFQGWLDQSGHESDPGDRRNRHQQQSPDFRESRFRSKAPPSYRKRHFGGCGTLHVPIKYESDEKSGKQCSI